MRNAVAVAIALVFPFIITACQGGGGSSGAPAGEPVTEEPAPQTPEIDFEAPGDGRLFKFRIVPVFTLHRTGEDTFNASYHFILYERQDMTIILAQEAGLVEDAAGWVRWIPEVELGSDRPYWWKWRIEYDGEGGRELMESPLYTFHAMKPDALRALSPRRDGFLDVNSADLPVLATINAYTFGDIDIEYEYELFDNPDGRAILSRAGHIRQDDSGFYTAALMPLTRPVGGWAALEGSTDTPPDIDPPPEQSDPSLSAEKRYYWRVRAWANGIPSAWSDLYIFTVRNLCGIRGSRFASYITEWTVARDCNALVRTNTDEALGGPNAGGFIDNDSPGHGFVSIDVGGILGVEMGSTVLDGRGSDIRVHQFISDELIELFAGLSERGPWYSLGLRRCDETCDYDLASAGLTYARYFRIKDGDSPQREPCHATSGADIDAVEALHTTSDASQCVQ